MLELYPQRSGLTRTKSCVRSGFIRLLPVHQALPTWRSSCSHTSRSTRAKTRSVLNKRAEPDNKKQGPRWAPARAQLSATVVVYSRRLTAACPVRYPAAPFPVRYPAAAFPDRLEASIAAGACAGLSVQACAASPAQACAALRAPLVSFASSARLVSFASLARLVCFASLVRPVCFASLAPYSYSNRRTSSGSARCSCRQSLPARSWAVCSCC